ncbi:arginine deiminase family protein [Fluoribacter gormanii]|uniref:Dimethylargininase n=1 Tax=Fluoribacter gormanii TaxID=464 RepID=A0A377GIU1_9GAMM|nr:arginine deiminase family protein [Fluoribacter gormanii]KTD00324.1 NG,NG-dimethylarginine dimethylaminohydrolase [Fluoribacter gormanii]MCW8472172.1 arginine deiminase family protein [Fluoribacter gormanii]SIQ91198.1 dimethylargininase [Fluoribacter gormanii]STO24701.1 N(G),N(G)-dimethylarginine dimethylaminohydrolase [Fluoribacter gormanii]
MFQQAIVRTPSTSLIHGLTSAKELGQPDYIKALEQHQSYINALIRCGLEVTVLPASDAFPDSCFVEDPALLTDRFAVLTRPGALSRQEEVNLIEPCIQTFYKNKTHKIEAPGTLEAGDVMQIEDHFYIGLSQRTNKEGVAQLTSLLAQYGFKSTVVELKKFLHLKTGVSYLGNKCLLVNGELVNHPAFKSFDQLIIDDSEAYAANSINVNNTVIMPQGFPRSIEMVHNSGFQVITTDVSEFRKIDGGLSCLSLRF